MRWIRFAGVGIAALVCGCSSAETNGNDVVQSADGRSAVDTLMALLLVRVESDDPQLHGRFVDYAQIRYARLSVDDQTWGLFEIAEELAVEGNGGGLALQDTREPALLIAELGCEIGGTDNPLDTVAEWVSLLDKHLAPGGHVAVLEELRIRPSHAPEIVLQPRSLVPFVVSQGDATAYVGEVVVALPMGESDP